MAYVFVVEMGTLLTLSLFSQEAVTALVIPKDGVTLTEDEIKDSLINAGLESYKCIHGGVKFVKEFPKNSTGKIERSKLPDLFMSLP